MLGNNRKYFLNEKETNFDDVKLKISLFIQILTYLKKPNSLIIIIGKFNYVLPSKTSISEYIFEFLISIQFTNFVPKRTNKIGTDGLLQIPTRARSL